MKKLIVALAAALLTASLVSAQDLASATETYNSGAEQLNSGDKVAALASFKQALTIASALGDEGAEITNNCKNVLPGLALAVGKQYNNEKKFAEAVASVQEALDLAKAYENADVAAEAENLLPGLKVSEALLPAEKALQAGDLPTAIEGYKKVLELDPTHKGASLRLVTCYANIGEYDNAKAALEVAKANGNGEKAEAALGKAYLKAANGSLKAKKFAEALSLSEGAIEFLPNEASAYLIAGNSAVSLNKAPVAIKYLEKNLELAPNAKSAGKTAFTVGALYHQQGNKEKAITFYKKAEALGFAAATEELKKLNK